MQARALWVRAASGSQGWAQSCMHHFGFVLALLLAPVPSTAAPQSDGDLAQ